jgi:hypothetical protein
MFFFCPWTTKRAKKRKGKILGRASLSDEKSTKSTTIHWSPGATRSRKQDARRRSPAASSRLSASPARSAAPTKGARRHTALALHRLPPRERVSKMPSLTQFLPASPEQRPRIAWPSYSSLLLVWLHCSAETARQAAHAAVRGGVSVVSHLLKCLLWFAGCLDL